MTHTHTHRSRGHPQVKNKNRSHLLDSPDPPRGFLEQRNVYTDRYGPKETRTQRSNNYLAVCGVREQSLSWSWNWPDWAARTGREKRKQNVISELGKKVLNNSIQSFGRHLQCFISIKKRSRSWTIVLMSDQWATESHSAEAYSGGAGGDQTGTCSYCTHQGTWPYWGGRGGGAPGTTTPPHCNNGLRVVWVQAELELTAGGRWRLLKVAGSRWRSLETIEGCWKSLGVAGGHLRSQHISDCLWSGSV